MEQKLVKKRKRYVNKLVRKYNVVQKVTPLDSIAKKITQSVVEMIALDNQPFSVVDNTGFQKLVHLLEPCTIYLHTYIVIVILQKLLYKEVKDRVLQQHEYSYKLYYGFVVLGCTRFNAKLNSTLVVCSSIK